MPVPIRPAPSTAPPTTSSRSGWSPIARCWRSTTPAVGEGVVGWDIAGVDRRVVGWIVGSAAASPHMCSTSRILTNPALISLVPTTTHGMLSRFQDNPAVVPMSSLALPCPSDEGEARRRRRLLRDGACPFFFFVFFRVESWCYVCLLGGGGDHRRLSIVDYRWWWWCRSIDRTVVRDRTVYCGEVLSPPPPPLN
jgi:hypothetical protein